MPNDKKFDLEERTAKFGEEIISFCKGFKKDVIALPIISQLIRSGTAVGALYCEADCAESRKDFEHKLGICKKEAKETKHWLRMVVKAAPESRLQAKPLWKEAHELQLIFITIIKKSREHSIKLVNH